MEFSAKTTIQASGERIFEILTDASAYPQFDPSCERIEGTIALGGTIKAWSKLSPGRAFPAKVVELERGKRMTWQGGMPLGLFKGVRTFTVEPVAGGAVELTLREVFSGPLLFLIKGSIPDMTQAFQGFVTGLKARAEAKS